MSGAKHVSTPTGWCKHINVYTVTRKTIGSKTVLLGGGRKKVRMRDGTEYALNGKNDKYGSTHAMNLHCVSMDAEIESENTHPPPSGPPPPLWDGWREACDESGVSYYYNEQNETRGHWERPCWSHEKKTEDDAIEIM